MKLYDKTIFYTKRFTNELLGIKYLYIAIFIINLIGALILYINSGTALYKLILLGMLGFLLGDFFYIGKKRIVGWPKNKTQIKREKKAKQHFCKLEYQIIWILFIIFMFFGLTLFIQKGIPLFHSSDNLLRSAFGEGTFGRIRAIVVWVPMCSLSMYMLYIRTGAYKISAYIMIGVALIYLMFYSYKGHILWLFIMLFYINYYIKNNTKISSLFMCILAAFFVMVLVFSVWLTEGIVTAASKLLIRITADQVDGLNYVYANFVNTYGFLKGGYLLSDLNKILTLSFTKTTFGIAELFYGRAVTWGIVITLYGFLYIDFGFAWTFIGFFFFGYAISSLHRYLSTQVNPDICTFISHIFMIFFWGKIFLVASVFTEIRGTLVSIIFFNLFYKFLYHFLPKKTEGYIGIERHLTEYKS